MDCDFQIISIDTLPGDF